MKHLFVPYELAVRLKEKGFDEPCFMYYFSDLDGSIEHTDLDNIVTGWNSEIKEASSIRCYAPLYQQVTDWFREKHKIEVLIIGSKSQKTFSWVIDANREVKYQKTHKKHLDTYYEALTKAIEEALKLI